MNKWRLAQLFGSAIDGVGLIKTLEALPGKRSLIILAYHGIYDPMGYSIFQEEELVSSHKEEFSKQLDYIKEHFEVISFSRLKNKLDSGYLFKNALIITFDDGYRDNYNIAYPLLKERNLTATVFLVTGHISTNKLIWFQKIFFLLKNTKKNRYS